MHSKVEEFYRQHNIKFWFTQKAFVQLLLDAERSEPTMDFFRQQAMSLINSTLKNLCDEFYRQVNDFKAGKEIIIDDLRNIGKEYIKYFECKIILPPSNEEGDIYDNLKQNYLSIKAQLWFFDNYSQHQRGQYEEITSSYKFKLLWQHDMLEVFCKRGENFHQLIQDKKLIASLDDLYIATLQHLQFKSQKLAAIKESSYNSNWFDTLAACAAYCINYSGNYNLIWKLFTSGYYTCKYFYNYVNKPAIPAKHLPAVLLAEQMEKLIDFFGATTKTIDYLKATAPEYKANVIKAQKTSGWVGSLMNCFGLYLIADNFNNRIVSNMLGFAFQRLFLPDFVPNIKHPLEFNQQNITKTTVERITCSNSSVNNFLTNRK